MKSKIPQSHLEKLPTELLSQSRNMTWPVSVFCGERGGGYKRGLVVVTKTTANNAGHSVNSAISSFIRTGRHVLI